MAVIDFDTDKLKINLLTINQYDELSDTTDSELYVVNETLDKDDPGNIISSKTYADKGREAVVTQNSEPTSQYTQIWINPDEEVVYITPANSDMDNITETGSANIVKALAPDFSKGTNYSQGAGSSFTVSKTGWLYVVYGASSSIEIKLNNASGVDLVDCVSTNNTKGSNHLLLEAGSTLFVNRREGTVYLIFYPCKGIA